MTDIISGPIVEPVTRAALGAIDVDGGATTQQLSVLSALVEHLWNRPDLDVHSLEPLDPSDTAAAITNPEHRRRFVWLISALEMCRRPISATQVERIETYASAIDVDHAALDIARTWLNDGADHARDDITRFFRSWHANYEEQQLRTRKVHRQEPDEQMIDLLDGFTRLPEGTLGREFIEFHERNGFEVPGEAPEGRFLRTFFVAHDMNHVITGYEPTPAGEIALAAMSFAASRCEPTWTGLLVNLSYHEGQLTQPDDATPVTTTLSDPAAVELLGDALVRGSACTSNFTFADHIAMAERPLDEVRGLYNISPA